MSKDRVCVDSGQGDGRIAHGGAGTEDRMEVRLS